jgi:hypothetical protein
MKTEKIIAVDLSFPESEPAGIGQTAKLYTNLLKNSKTII